MSSFPKLVPLPSPVPSAITALIDSYDQGITQILANGSFTSSLTVNLVYNQTVLWTKGYGLKNLSDPNSVPNGDTGYRIGSNSKIFTTLLALIAKEKGLLSLDDPVNKYIPQFSPINPFPAQGQKPITINHLASHMAGLPREPPCTSFAVCNLTNDQMWKNFKSVPLVAPPGTIPEYSNAGFAILGHLVEQVFGGTDWRTLLQKLIATPLGLTFTGAVFTPQVEANMALGYDGNMVEPLEFYDIGWEGPAGQLYSTTNDLAKLMNLFFRDDVPINYTPNQILDGTTIRDWRDPKYINVDGSGYGIPWEIYASPIFYTKGGSVPGYLSEFIAVPDLKFGTVILQSSGTSEAYQEVMNYFVTVIFPAFVQYLEKVEPAPYIPTNIHGLSGTYPFDLFGHITNMTFQMQKIPNSIWQQFVANDLFVLEYISPNIFLGSTFGMELACGAAEAGYTQYFHFDDSTNPPTLSIPGLFPGVKATRY